MKVGDKVLAEGTVTMIGEGFCRVAFGRVGTQAVTHVRVLTDDLKPAVAKAKKPAVAD